MIGLFNFSFSSNSRNCLKKIKLLTIVTHENRMNTVVICYSRGRSVQFVMKTRITHSVFQFGFCRCVYRNQLNAVFASRVSFKNVKGNERVGIDEYRALEIFRFRSVLLE